MKFLPYISIIPLTPLPSHDPQWFLTTGGYPAWQELGVSTMWSYMDEEGNLIYCLVVQNNSGNTQEYAFVEADF